jgi:Gpi18-like mannosyltransferase
MLTYAALTFTPSTLGHPHTSVVTLDTLVTSWVRHDSAWYLQIAAHGYTPPQTLAFFPLYPALIRLATLLCFGNAPLAAILVARLACYPAFLGMLALAWQELGPRISTSRLALAITLAYPLAFFFGAAYTESLFLAAAAFALLFLRRHAWGWAALFTFIAAVSRPTGLILILPVAWEWARTERPWQHWRIWREWRTWRDGALLLGAVPAAYVVMAVISMQAMQGDPKAFISIHSKFDRVTLAPWEIVRLLFGAFYPVEMGSFAQAHNLTDAGLVIVFIVLVIVGAVRRAMPVSFVLYMAGLIVLIIASPTPNLIDPFVSSGRFLTAAIPVFLLLATWAERRPWLTWLIIGGGLYLQAVLAAYFLIGGWII